MAPIGGRNPLTSKYTSSPSEFAYDVFLSFRGVDTRRNFTDHLYAALINAGFRTFRDKEKLERGENIKEKLEKAIQQSRSSVIVFSKSYTTSRWCLDELVMIVERRRTSDHVVLPVFYKVSPSEVRKHEDLANIHPKQSLEKLNGWRAALKEAADLAGMDPENEADGYEAKFIQDIVGKIQKKLPRVNQVPLVHLQKELEDKLSSVSPVLDEAEGKQLQFQTSMKPWLSKLKEAVYEAEDLLQEIKTEVLRQKMEPECGSSSSQGHELISSPPSNAFDSARIHPKVEEILNGLDCIMEGRRNVLGMEAGAGYRVSQTFSSTCLVEERVYGRDDEKEALVRLLLSDNESGNNIGTIPIVGMAGIGKTTLAQFIYNDVTVIKHFDLRAWACVSTEFDVLRISQHIMESLTDETCEIRNLSQVQSMLQAKVKGKRFFLVLDDMWNTNYNQFELLMRPLKSVAHGSKIIVTTRNEDVARMTGTHSPQRDHLKPISEEDGWLLFEKHAFTSTRGGSGHPQLEVIGRQIVRKCHGLPLALKSLAGLLRSKLDSDEWENILNSEIWELPPEESDILPSLWLSYVHLPPHLKRCFSYCSIFPKSYRLRKSELLFLWKAQGFLQPKRKKTEEQVGEEYFNDLISRSFLQRSTGSEHFTMHDLLIDLADFVSGKFCVRWEDSESPKIWSDTCHFTYMEINGDSFAELKAIREAKYLRTLLPLPKYPHYLGAFNKRKFQEVLYEVLPKLQFLRVLNLSMYDIKELPDAINSLKHLRHLDMSETTITKLPDTICTLYNLQALLLRKCCHLEALPTNLGRLINLSHLDIRDTNIKKLPPHMDYLKDLQILYKALLDADGHLSVELKKLSDVQGKLCISGLGKLNGRVLDANIVRDKKLLIKFTLKWEYICQKDDKQIEVLEKVQPPLDLEMLTISGYGGQVFPGWSGYYLSSALVCLHLKDSANCVSLPPLGQLSSLKELDISGLDGVVSVGREFYYGEGSHSPTTFKSLRSLQFYDMKGWKEWSFVGGDNIANFPNVKTLTIWSCEKLSLKLPQNMYSHFPSLVDLEVRYCPELEMECNPEGGFPSLLESFTIIKCKVLHVDNIQNLDKALRRLSSLKRVIIEFDWFNFKAANTIFRVLEISHVKNIGAIWFDPLNSLQFLCIKDCPRLRFLPDNELPASLKYLFISRCPELECLPDCPLPDALVHLRIIDCPLLGKWCARKRGADWPKIAHIPTIEIRGCGL